jgi:hypothetical protein
MGGADTDILMMLVEGSTVLSTTRVDAGKSFDEHAAPSARRDSTSARGRSCDAAALSRPAATHSVGVAAERVRRS